MEDSDKSRAVYHLDLCGIVECGADLCGQLRIGPGIPGEVEEPQ